MGNIRSSDPCRICGKNYPLMNSHHTIPQSRGGKHSEQVILCPTCHDLLHAWALSILSKKPTQAFFAGDNEANAKPYCDVLVKAMSAADGDLDIDLSSAEHPISFKMSEPEFQRLKLLAQDMALSQTNAVKKAIEEALHNRGLNDSQHKASNENKSRNKVWWL